MTNHDCKFAHLKNITTLLYEMQNLFLYQNDFFEFPVVKWIQLTGSAVTSSDVEYLSRSTSNWPKCYFVTTKSNARNCYSSKSKKVSKF